MYHRVALPVYDGGPDAARTIIDDIDNWVSSDPIATIVGCFGGVMPRDSLDARLAYLEEFASQHWDYRDGKERQQARREVFSEATAAEAVKVAHALGLVDAAPPRHQQYTHVLVLGGLVRTCLERVRYASMLLDSGIESDQVSAIGCYRPINDSEKELAAQLGMQDARYEVDAMAAGVRWSFGVSSPVTLEHEGDPAYDANRSWSISTYATQRAMIRVVAAPSLDPDKRRANTADTCEFWANNVVDLSADDRVLVVTSSLYVPFQHCDAIANIGLPHGCGIETVGINLVGAHECRSQAADRYLQELNSAIVSMRRLYKAATAAKVGNTAG